MKKRQMILLPQINPRLFVLFFVSGESGLSWSIRDYSAPHGMAKYGPDGFRWTADQVRAMAAQAVDAPRHPTGDLNFWHQHTIECNQAHGIHLPEHTRTDVSVNPARAAAEPLARYPILNSWSLRALPKWKKDKDRTRILTSSISEDWVTWNFFQLLLELHPSDWFSILLAAAHWRNTGLVFPFPAAPLPKLSFWAPVASPRLYEESRRAAMKASGNPEWVARANDPRPVEGDSEIEVSLDRSEFLLYIEAKLMHDISPNVKRDPARNQIIRNIDCLLELAGDRTPIFWMLVRDIAPSRSYVQLMDAYRRDPSLLAAALPHRAPAEIARVARNMTILLWGDFKAGLSGPSTGAEMDAVRQEWERRIVDPGAE